MIFPTLVFKMEKWKFNHEYGVYVSTLGHFKDRCKRNLPIKINHNGYCCVLTEKGMITAHRLVLLTWRPIPNREKMTVDHLNHNKRDNSLCNLEWVSEEENLRRAAIDTYNDKIQSAEQSIKINGMKMTISEAVDFIMYSNINVNKDKLSQYLKNFCKDKNPNRKKIYKYNMIIEK